jgi:hypothetical protein
VVDVRDDGEVAGIGDGHSGGSGGRAVYLG